MFQTNEALTAGMGEEGGTLGYLQELLGCPAWHLKPSKTSDRAVLLASDSWLCSLLSNRRLPPSLDPHPSLTQAEVLH